MLWHEQTWPVIRDLDKDIPVVVPLGSLEQHGHHLPLFVDSIQVQQIAQMVEQRMKDRLLLLPTQWLGCSDHHRDFPGTISVSSSVYMQMVKSLARGILSAGFQRIFFLNGHGGNEAPAAAALAELIGESDRADGAHLAFASWWQVAADVIAKNNAKMRTPGISHACEYETSMILAIRPELAGQAASSTPVIENAWYSSEYGGKVQLFHRYHRLTSAGSMGSPSAGTAEKGRELLETVVSCICAFLADFAKWPLLPVIAPK